MEDDESEEEEAADEQSEEGDSEEEESEEEDSKVAEKPKRNAGKLEPTGSRGTYDREDDLRHALEKRQDALRPAQENREDVVRVSAEANCAALHASFQGVREWKCCR